MRIASALVLLAFAACGDDASSTDTASDTAADTSGEVSPDTTADTTADTADSAPDTTVDTAADTGDDTPDTAGDTAENPRVDEACSEQGYTDCFINDDCVAAERCENMSANDVEIPCCVVGPRGTGQTGEPCDSENDCETSLCISLNEGPLLCSAPCAGPEECPESATDCKFGLCVPP